MINKKAFHNFINDTRLLMKPKSIAEISSYVEESDSLCAVGVQEFSRGKA